MQQEQIFSRWDEYIGIFVQAHNQSASVYGHSPETLMFRYQKPIQTDLLKIWPNASDPQEYMDIIVGRAEQQATDHGMSNQHRELQQDKPKSDESTERGPKGRHSGMSPTPSIDRTQFQSQTPPHWTLCSTTSQQRHIILHSARPY